VDVHPIYVAMAECIQNESAEQLAFSRSKCANIKGKVLTISAPPPKHREITMNSMRGKHENLGASKLFG